MSPRLRQSPEGVPFVLWIISGGRGQDRVSAGEGQMPEIHTVILSCFVTRAGEGRGLSCALPTRNQVPRPRRAESYSGRRIRRSLAPLKTEPEARSGYGCLTLLRPPQSGENPRGQVNTKTNFYFNKVNSQQCDTEGEGFSCHSGAGAMALTRRHPSPYPSCPHCQDRGQSTSGRSYGGDPTPGFASSGLQALQPPLGLMPFPRPQGLPTPTPFLSPC